MRRALVMFFLFLASAASAQQMDSREASGTSWQPASTPFQGVHVMHGDWMLMAHGYAFGAYDRQGGRRGDDKVVNSGMLMLMARRPAGPGTFGLRAMASLDPTMGPGGYPLLLQTGETADGADHLADRQHPHDLFMELAATYYAPFAEEGSAFGYFGLPGEPALGPSAFMHRFSGVENPEAPLGHHWLDSTHIAYGVGTFGFIWGPWKLDASTFKGREPDQRRWDMEAPKFDSYSGRLAYNPTENWSLQASYGYLVAPEQLEPDVNTRRLTASASYNRRFADAGDYFSQTMFAFGRNMNTNGLNSNAFLLESALRIYRRHTLFARAERVDKDELFEPGDPLAGRSFAVNKLSAGYTYDFARWKRSQWGVGALGSLHFLPAALRPAYGNTPGSFQVFVRAKII